MHMCVCVCVIFFHHSVILFSSSIWLLWYIGYDDFISMNNVFVFVLIIIIFLLVLSLANMKNKILEKSLFSISDEFLYFSLFLHFIYFCISICIFFNRAFYYIRTTFFVFLSFYLSVCLSLSVPVPPWYSLFLRHSFLLSFFTKMCFSLIFLSFESHNAHHSHYIQLS